MGCKLIKDRNEDYSFGIPQPKTDSIKNIDGNGSKSWNEYRKFNSYMSKMKYDLQMYRANNYRETLTIGIEKNIFRAILDKNEELKWVSIL